jgi:8-oxo-dGTP pyrophosphatase MutT (NUDIX family)
MRRAALRAGAIAYRRRDNVTEVLLVSASDDPTQLVFPKGHIEGDERASVAALRELQEEAGVTGRLVGPVCPKLRFKHDDELVEVQYFVVASTGEGRPVESRQVHWLRLSDVKSKLHADAKAMFDDAVPLIRADAQVDPIDEATASRLKDLLIAEYAHTADSLLRNEEDGEHRVRFFITLAGALSSVALFVRGERTALAPDKIDPVLVFLFAFLALIGYQTLLRIVQRNVASDRYKSGLDRIRRSFVPSPSDPGVRALAFDPYDAGCRRITSWRSLGRGGWLETVALVEALLVGALISLLVRSPSWALDGILAVVVAVLTWILLMSYTAHLYRVWHRSRT